MIPHEERKPLSPEEVYRQLHDAPGWVVERQRIYRDFRFENFADIVAFVNRVAGIAERVGHHPNILIHEYHFVRIESYDHLTGGLSTKDVELAHAIDALSAK